MLRLALVNADERHAGAALDVVPETLKISADPELLAQALLNLLRNAFRVTADVEKPIVVLAITRQSGSRFRIEVRDNGPGIPAERREDVFLPFYTTHKGGSGVGLSFARQVALAHGGSISAGDSPEGGASIALMI